MMKLFYLILLLTFIPSSYSEVLTRNLTVNSNKVTIIKNFSVEEKFGLIQVKICDICTRYELSLDDNTVFILNGSNQPTENLLRTRLTQPSKAVRIQYNNEDSSVSYIRWNPVAEF